MSLMLAWCVAIGAGGGNPSTQPASGWIWTVDDARQGAANQTIYFRFEFDLNVRPPSAPILLTADNAFKLSVNGASAASSVDWLKPVRIDVAGALKPGRNCIAVEASNGGGPAGLIVQGGIHEPAGVVLLDTGSNWNWSDKVVSGWDCPGAPAADWKPAAVLGPADMAPWNLAALRPNTVDLGVMAPPVDWEKWRARQRDTRSTLPRPADPPGDPGRHPIDRFLAVWWDKEGITSPNLCDDSTFARRAWLDLHGWTPTDGELKRFLDDASPHKRARLIDSMLAEDAAYSEGWMAWWCDLLRNDEQTSIDGLRKPITQWLFPALLSNMPYDRMVAELLNPGHNGPDGYLKGVNWRGRVNASQQPPVQAAQNVGQVFLATNIKCASCHDHFTRPYLLDDSYGLAAFFSDTNLEVYRCDKPTGHVMGPVFPIRGLGEVPENADRSTRGRAVAEMVTSPRNPNFAKAIANRLWKKLMGRGLFEPVDDIYAKPSNPELLDWLAFEVMRQDYDLKKMIRLLMTSRAYQLESVPESGDQLRAANKVPGVYRGPTVRRLSSEQFQDSLSRLTGHWPKVPAMVVEVSNPNIRAWRQKVPNGLAMALGRPTREQVTTCREDDASMLQMLEMVNGVALAKDVNEGAKQLLASALGLEKTETVIDVLCLRAYGRAAFAQEREVMAPMLGAPGAPLEERQAGWEDVIWLLVMNPEFQFIY